MPPNDLAQLQKGIETIKSLLQGNPLDKEDNGLIGTVNAMDARMKLLEQLKDRIKDRFTYLVIGLSIPAGFGITEILSILAKTITHTVK